MMPATILLQLLILVPVLGAFGIYLLGKYPDRREAVTLVSSLAVMLGVVLLYMAFVSADQDGEIISVHWISLLPGLELKFVLEPLGMIFAMVAGILWLVTSIYAIGYMRGNNEKHQTRFFMLFPLAISAAMGIAFAGNLLTLFVFYEVLTLSTYPLVTHKGNADAIRSGRIYLGVLISTSIGLLLPAILWTWHVAGTTDFVAGGILVGKLDGSLLTILAAMFVLGIGKAAVMPAHRWLPAAMVAPTPVSALLHAVAVVKAGVFCVLKVIIYTLGIDHLSEAPNIDWLFALAAFTIIAASVIALQQDNLKKRLAYSTISQLSYVVMAALVLAPISMLGAALHIVAHAFGKITLFFAAGAIYTASKKTNVSQLDGIGRRMPWTMVAFSIGALSMIGVPPAVGFISKWYMVMGAVQADNMAAIGVVVLSTLLNTAYFVPIIYAAFFKQETDAVKGYEQHGEAPLPMVIALTITAGATLIVFFYPAIPFALAKSIGVG